MMCCAVGEISLPLFAPRDLIGRVDWLHDRYREMQRYSVKSGVEQQLQLQFDNLTVYRARFRKRTAEIYHKSYRINKVEIM